MYFTYSFISIEEKLNGPQDGVGMAEEEARGRKKKIKRLKKNYEFNYVYRRGQSAASREMILFSAKNRGSETKVGFSVSKKLGKSVKRNRIKRWMREAVKNQFIRMQIGYNYIVAARSGIIESSYQKVEQSLIYMLKKTGRYCPEKRNEP